MSLIDEALKRAELEAARRDGLRGGTYPWVPEQMPRRRRRWIAAAIAAVCVVVAAAGALWVLRRPAAPAAPVQSPKAKVQRSPAGELETVEVPPPPAGRPSLSTAREKEASAAGSAKESGPPGSPRDAARLRNTPPAEPRTANAPAQEKSGRGLADGKTYFGEVSVPDGAKIELGGIVFSESNPVALINDRVMGPGASVGEFTIVSIQPDRVEMKGRGITIFLALK